MDPLQVLEAAESAQGKNNKQAILREHKGNLELGELLDAALNFKRKFWIKKFDDNPSGTFDLDDYVTSYSAFMKLLTALESRSVTGNAAILFVENFMRACNDTERKWYSRILRKDLKSGYGISTANKAGHNIPIFEVQLAKDGNKCKKVNQMLKNGVFASPKLDGYRCLAVIEGGVVTLHSRNGTVFENFPSVAESLAKAWGDKDIVLDGEIMSSDFNSMQQTAFSSKSGKSVGDVAYNIFDVIPITEWNSETFAAPAGDRYEVLSVMFIDAASKGMLSPNLREIQHLPVTTLEEILKLEKQFITLGYEGVMVNPNIPYYKGKKSNKMLKFKTMLSMEATVTGCYEGRPGTKYVGTLGGIHVLQENGVTCDIGSGFSDSERDNIWANQEQINGRMMEAAYQELTPDKVMRFPIFKRWRPDKE